MCRSLTGRSFGATIAALTIVGASGCGGSHPTGGIPAGQIPTYSSTYSAAFQGPFLSSCEEKHSASSCVCFLRQIENVASEQTVVAASGDIDVGDQPAWYQEAVSDCM